MQYKYKIVIILIAVSFIQAYLSYLLHNDYINVLIIGWVIGVFAAPMYFILLCIGETLEAVFGLNYSKGGYIFPYLKDYMWIIGFFIMLPINFYIGKTLKYFLKSKRVDN